MMVILALGSNIGDQIRNLQTAVKLLPLHNKLCSSVYKNPAMLPSNAPNWWNVPFLNMAVAGYTDLTPNALLQNIKRIEYGLGRLDKTFWSPRIIDIDIVLWEGISIESVTLTIPHKEMLNRDFVLAPVCDICPQFPHVVMKETVESLIMKKQNINVIKTHSNLPPWR
ncbi:MAG: 2-amino-4-hydroxy-6-hydroxymethyldihydropteridine diphosphokinase [Aaplasma endosymbiont of Hyalomma asiaticum]